MYLAEELLADMEEMENGDDIKVYMPVKNE